MFGHSRNRKNVKSADKVFRKHTLESLIPGTLGPSSPTKLEKNHNFKIFGIYAKMLFENNNKGGYIWKRRF